MKKLTRRAAYTLVELIIVIGIISVLCTLSINVFSGSLEHAENAVCQANRRNMKAELSYAILLNGSEPAAVFPEVREKYSCPSGGSYSLDYDAASYTVTVSCSLHRDEVGAGGSLKRPVTVSDFQTLNKVLQENTGKISSSSGGVIDSAAPESFNGSATKKALLKQLMKEAGVDMDTLDMASWTIESKASNGVTKISSIIWTTADISKLESGDKVFAIKYNFDEYPNADYRKVFSVWEYTVRSTSEDGVRSYKPEEDYNVIYTGSNATELTGSKNISISDKARLDAVMKVYNDAVTADTSGTKYGT